MVGQVHPSHRARVRDPGVVLWAVAAACWAALLVSLVSGVGAHDHGLGGPGAPAPAAVPVFVGSWVLMVGAMMLPTTVPMVRLFTVVSARQPRPAAARAAFLAGYLALWTLFGLVALAAATGLQVAAASWSWLDVGPRWVLAGVLAVAGAFQFSGLKGRCLTQCRDPRAFLYQHYRRGVRGGWEVGLRHGWSCLGCCWALMLVMFGAGVADLLVMVGLTAVMVAEKNTRWGRWMAAPVGVLLLFAAAAVALGIVPAGAGHA
ncbi:DUF2182 domain-containing protein [Pseudonocardia hispaniensis]|uniref:DUF2182 domain-containing protein n=1 Tax=Pseudonocardia hispaniensis TaxID=904933 RepID=A0ABW1J4H5_9PSEU